jgi:hypothetical protein
MFLLWLYSIQQSIHSHAMPKDAAVRSASDRRTCAIAPSWAFQPVATGGVCWLVSTLMSMFYSDGMRAVLRTYVPQWQESARRVPGTRRMFELFEQMIKHDPKFDLQREVRGQLRPNPDTYMLPGRLLTDVLNKVTQEELQQIGGIYARTAVETNSGYYPYTYTVYLMNMLGFRVPDDLMAISVPTAPSNPQHQAFFRQGRLAVKEARLQHVQPKVLIAWISHSWSGLVITSASRNPRYPKIITFNGAKYTLDACQLTSSSYRTMQEAKDLNTTHAVTGVTCRGKQYMHNGWPVGKVTASKRNLSYDDDAVPCPLIEFDWMTDVRDFRMNPVSCDLDYFDARAGRFPPPLPNGDSGNTLYYNARLGTIALLYVRTSPPCAPPRAQSPVDDPTEQERKQKAEACAAKDKILHVSTERCVDRKGAIGVITPIVKAATSKKKKGEADQTRKAAEAGITESERRSNAVCGDTKIINPKTGRCVLRTGNIGREVLKQRLARKNA